jgi:hypothetical protein
MDIIKNSLRCSDCKQILSEPVLLPCGRSVCKRHTSTEMKEYNCKSCKLAHPIPDAGFYSNKSLEDIVKTRIHEIDLGENYENAVSSCDRLSKIIQEITEIKSNPISYITVSIEKLKMDLEMLREEKKLQIDEYIDKIVDELDKREAACKNDVDTNDYRDTLDYIDEEITKAVTDLNEWQQALNVFHFNENEWLRIKETSEKKALELEAEVKNLKRKLLLDKLSDVDLEEIRTYAGHDLFDTSSAIFEAFQNPDTDVEANGDKMNDRGDLNNPFGSFMAPQSSHYSPDSSSKRRKLNTLDYFDSFNQNQDSVNDFKDVSIMSLMETSQKASKTNTDSNGTPSVSTEGSNGATDGTCSNNQTTDRGKKPTFWTHEETLYLCVCIELNKGSRLNWKKISEDYLAKFKNNKTPQQIYDKYDRLKRNYFKCKSFEKAAQDYIQKNKHEFNSSFYNL